MVALIFCALGALFFLHQSGAFDTLRCSWFLDGYLDPFLLMPILLQLVLQEQIMLFGKPAAYRLPLKKVAALTIAVSAIAEIGFPALSPAFIADLLDVLCYAAGSAFFFLFMNRNMLRENQFVKFIRR